MAALWQLPIIYIIENNQYGMGTSVERASAMTELFRRGESLGIKGYEIDGMDPLAVNYFLKDIHNKIVNDNLGPVLIEAKTYRYRGHSMSDPGKYRTREEIQETRENRDPIERVGTLSISLSSSSFKILLLINKVLTLSIGSLFSLVSCISSLVLYLPGSDIECPLYLAVTNNLYNRK
jgi:pyruvate dehydrogenase E1 component alpha subunit